VGVGAVIVNDQNETLLLLRKKSPEKGCWDLPGGRVELGETIEAAILREIKEELGVDVKIIKLLRVTNHILEEENTHWVAPAFLSRIVSQGEPENLEPHSHEAVQWFPLDALPENITITAAPALESYLEESK
ncbi:MAG: NUDIX domain-containing protein, partial [bacterium]|nr:NUDIX domain-containing protein [bacterium]